MRSQKWFLYRLATLNVLWLILTTVKSTESLNHSFVSAVQHLKHRVQPRQVWASSLGCFLLDKTQALLCSSISGAHLKIIEPSVPHGFDKFRGEQQSPREALAPPLFEALFHVSPNVDLQSVAWAFMTRLHLLYTNLMVKMKRVEMKCIHDVAPIRGAPSLLYKHLFDKGFSGN